MIVGRVAQYSLHLRERNTLRNVTEVHAEEIFVRHNQKSLAM